MIDSAKQSEVAEWFESIGLPLKNYGLISVSGYERGLIVFYYPGVGFRYAIIENDDLASACYDFLRDKGVRMYDTAQTMIDKFSHKDP
jgi:hypothetical protein